MRIQISVHQGGIVRQILGAARAFRQIGPVKVWPVAGPRLWARQILAPCKTPSHNMRCTNEYSNVHVFPMSYVARLPRAAAKLASFSYADAWASRLTSSCTLGTQLASIPSSVLRVSSLASFLKKSARVSCAVGLAGAYADVMLHVHGFLFYCYCDSHRSPPS